MHPEKQAKPPRKVAFQPPTKRPPEKQKRDNFPPQLGAYLLVIVTFLHRIAQTLSMAPGPYSRLAILAIALTVLSLSAPDASVDARSRASTSSSSSSSSSASLSRIAEPFTASMIAEQRARVKDMFHHAYDNYMEHAFPHDELKPMSRGSTDSLIELGNARPSRASRARYEGVALTLIDTLDTLVVVGEREEFAKQVRWIVENVSFDQDARVHVFEATIRVLGGLLSAHLLAEDADLALMDDYDGGLLVLADDLGQRLLPAFLESPTDIPYPFVNLRRGVTEGETSETCTAGVGTLLLEFGLLSNLTGDMRYIDVADRALVRLWSMRSDLNLLGNTLNGATHSWVNSNAGIGAGVDSFYEYLLKASIMFDNPRYMNMFELSYAAVMRHLRRGPWYFEADMRTARPSHLQFNSLQAFWPGMQVLLGRDYDAAIKTHSAIYGIWKKYHGLPERFLLHSSNAHSTERYYPLRPEFIESTYFLYRLTRDDHYLHVGKQIIDSIEKRMRVRYGYASVRNVVSGELEDHMTSFFLSETVKYLYLLFADADADVDGRDAPHFVHDDSRREYIFTTEGHLFPLHLHLHNTGQHPEHDSEEHRDYVPRARFSQAKCMRRTWPNWQLERPSLEGRIPAFEAATRKSQHSCSANTNKRPRKQQQQQQSGAQNARMQEIIKQFKVEAGAGNFRIEYRGKEVVTVRNLGTSQVEITDETEIPDLTAVPLTSVLVLDDAQGLLQYRVFFRKEPITPAMDDLGNAVPPPVVPPVEPCSSMLLSAASAFFAPVPEPCSAEERESGECKTVEYVPPFATGRLVVVDADFDCEAPPGVDFEGAVVMLNRGVCTFVDKVMAYQEAGAAAVLVANDRDGYVKFMMGHDGSDRTISIPAFMISQDDGETVRDCFEAHRDQGQHIHAMLAVEVLADADAVQKGLEDRTLETRLLEAVKSEEDNERARAPRPLVLPDAPDVVPVVGCSTHFRYLTHGDFIIDVELKEGAYHMRLVSTREEVEDNVKRK